MPNLDRRRFLQLAGGAAALTALPQSIARAASIPAHRVHGDLRDVEHIVILVQENRSFDHYFGTLRGVRGFGDPHPARQENGQSIWNQSGVLPFRPDLDDMGLAFLQDLDHGWVGGHESFNAGAYDNWVPVKTSTTMAHLERRDIPFHYALADAFTICDAYHCSLLGPTDPNRYYAWTGWVGNDHRGGGPVIANDELGYDWTTYPERLLAAGVDWKIYQDQGVGLTAAGYWGWTSDAYIGNYGDNSLLYFHQYQNAQPGSPLYEGALRGTNAQGGESFFTQLERDVQAGTLPAVSWIAAPEAFTEHPNWPANYGAWYVAKVLDALTSDPEVWSKTALFITYDENDGFFDHVVPPHPNTPGVPGASTVSLANEHYDGRTSTPGGTVEAPGNYGLGVRVPMLVVSPWSTGGWVCSETFDHTSLIRFIEARHGVGEPNITPWRRTVCGDLTAAFDFGTRRTAVPTLPSTATYAPPDALRHPDYVPTPPAQGALPKQEPGVRPSRALGYGIDIDADVRGGQLEVWLRNRGRLGAQFQARTSVRAPRSYTVGAGEQLRASWPVAGAYDVSLHGPDGLFRRFAGDATQPGLRVALSGRTLRLVNTSTTALRVQVVDRYGHAAPRTVRIGSAASADVPVDVAPTGGWYDIVVSVAGQPAFARELAGRIHDGRPGTSDPQLG